MQEENKAPQINVINVLSDEDTEAVSAGMTYDDLYEIFGTYNMKKFHLFVHFTINGVPNTHLEIIEYNDKGQLPYDGRLDLLGKNVIEWMERYDGAPKGSYQFTGVEVKLIYEPYDQHVYG